MDKDYKPFAITAKCLGSPKRLYTKILVVNLDSDDRLTAKYVNALWDTGADTSLMTRELAQDLGFKFSKKVESRGFGSPSLADLGYALVALVSNGETVETLTAVVEDMPCDDYSFIIGMDLISKGTLAISSSQFETSLSFTIQTVEHVDFVKSREKLGFSTEYLELSSWIEDKRIFRGTEVLDQLIPKMKESKS